MNTYTFNISLSVLNHLGRNLYRNFITVIGEAISNSWDADANHVWIDINKDKNDMLILDDGCGMDDDDFQNKFLKIGYSKRRDNTTKSPKGRPFIGRKGIGKLALLSCAEKIHIATKTMNGEPVGGLIDNSELDKAITDDVNSQDYTLQLPAEAVINRLRSLKQGTAVYFEKINDEIVNTIEYIKKAIALYFKFSLIDKDFLIYVNGDLIDNSYLDDFALKTEFVWIINESNDPFLNSNTSIKNVREVKRVTTNLPIKGYIATTFRPADTKIRGTNEKNTLDLFVNGRIREKDILKHIPSARIVENYTFGQIHCDSLDPGTGKDIFTSSREGVISNDSSFIEVLIEVQQIFRSIIEEWDVLRRKYGSEGDPDNTTITKKARRAQELYQQTVKEMDGGNKIGKKGGEVEKWVDDLAEEAQFNIPSYTECFISENLLRKYIDYTNTGLSTEAKREANQWKDKEKKNKEAANICYEVRQSSGELYYLSMSDLANLVDKVPADKPKSPGLSRSAIVYKPMRDAVGHTSLLTDMAKKQLTLEYGNIQARLIQILKDFESKKNNKGE